MNPKQYLHGLKPLTCYKKKEEIIKYTTWITWIGRRLIINLFLVLNNCIIQTDDNTRQYYDKEIQKLAQEILNLKIAKPALRALVNQGIYTVSDLQNFGLLNLSQLHGFGPNALRKIAQLFNEDE